ncbi:MULTISPECIES: helix-turn-helix domain-containing protein [unclassified Myroides]|uniref:helix-turn-helix domain-containing protein n=1 Tax=unclassified Myroides TaxID=2642485 RepID=UPI003D2F57B3
MLLKKRLFLSFFLFSSFLGIAASSLCNESIFKHWSKQELLFCVTNDLLNSVDQSICIENYLQKAKEENLVKAIINAYRKKTLLPSFYETKSKSADSLLQYVPNAKDKKDVEKALHYPKLLMDILSKLHQTNDQLRSYIHTYLDINRQKPSKRKLEQELFSSPFWIKELNSLAYLLFLIVIGGVLYLKKRRQNMQKRYKQVIRELYHPYKEDWNKSQQASEFNISLTESIKTEQLITLSSVLHKKLAYFEESKRYLQKITLDELARQLGTNRNTLSKFFNEEKQISFPNYLKQLRIQHAMYELTHDPKLYELNLTGLAHKFGFGSAKGLSTAFKEITKLSVTDFIKMRKQDEDFKDIDQKQPEA